jgi:hypothetical protein
MGTGHYKRQRQKETAQENAMYEWAECRLQGIIAQHVIDRQTWSKCLHQYRYPNQHSSLHHFPRDLISLVNCYINASQYVQPHANFSIFSLELGCSICTSILTCS